MSALAYDPNYIHTPTLFVVGQKAVIFNQKGKILVLLRSDKVGHSGKWSLPGGGLEANESLELGITREIEEETQLKVTGLRLLAAHLGSENSQHSSVVLGYQCQATTTAVQLNWEHDDFRWLLPEQALQLDLGSQARFFIKQAQEYNWET